MPRSDFNGDGRSDILWRNGSLVSDWLGTSTGGFVINDANASHILNDDYLIIGTGDFNGDGRDDLLIRYHWSLGATVVKVALANDSGGFAASFSAGTIGRGSQVSAIGDFNHDGREDLAVTAGSKTTIWFANSSGAFEKSNLSANYSADWKVIAAGDFNGDGFDDLLFRNSAGVLSNWLGGASGFIVNDANALAEVPTNWRVAGIGDFNGDGRDDILWRSDDGAFSDWLGQANGGFVINDANAFNSIPTDWQIAAVGDYNGDGRDDILWRNSVTGAMSDWLGTGAGGFVINDANAFAVVPAEWEIQPIDGTLIHWGIIAP